MKKVLKLVPAIGTFLLLSALLVKGQPSLNAQTDWMFIVKDTDENSLFSQSANDDHLVFGKFNVNCHDIYGSDVDMCLLQSNFVNATNLSVNYVQAWVKQWFYNKTEVNTMFNDYYTKVQSDARFSPIIWAYNQTTPAITFTQNWVTNNYWSITQTQNWVTSNYWNITQIINGYFNKTESDARYMKLYNDSAVTRFVYAKLNTTANVTNVLVPISNLTWNATSGWMSFECLVTYTSIETGTGIGLAIDVYPNSSVGVISYTAGIPKGNDGAGAEWQGWGTAVNDIIEAGNTPDNNVPFTARIFGNMRLDANATIKVEFEPSKSKLVTARAGSECRWWNYS